MRASVLDRFIFGTATAIHAIPAIRRVVAAEKGPGIAGIAEIAVANKKDYGFFDAISNVPDDQIDIGTNWLTTLNKRANHCDRLIDQLCNLRGDSAAERTVLLKTRRNTSPANLDTDITYLLTVIAALTPAPLVPATGRCIDCQSFRRAGVGERCGHAARCTPGEPPVTDCLPAHTCSLFVHWRGA